MEWATASRVCRGRGELAITIPLQRAARSRSTIRRQLKVASTPLVPFRLFRSRSLTGANIVILLVGAAFSSKN